jgi:DNA repair exonuclease SbcCD nuclease subunit
MLYVHCGDLFESLTDKIDKAIFLDVYNKFSEFSKSEIVIVLLVGNHDWLDRTETKHILEPFKEIENTIVVDKPRIENIDSVSLSFIPFTRVDFRGKVESVIPKGRRAIRTDDRALKYLFTHQGVHGAAVGPRDLILREEYTMEDFRPDSFDMIFNGHYHKHQKLSQKFFIVGSYIQRDFGERNDVKGFISLNSESKSLSFIPTNGPRFFKVSVSSPKTFVRPEGLREQDFLWIVAADESVDVSSITRDIGNVRVDIEERTETRVRSDLSISMPVEEQLAKYIAIKNPKLDHKKLLEMGVDKWKRSL